MRTASPKLGRPLIVLGREALKGAAAGSRFAFCLLRYRMKRFARELCLLLPFVSSLITARCVTHHTRVLLVRRLLQQTPSRFVRPQSGMALVAVVHPVHLLDGVEVADDVSGAERFAGLDRFPVNLLNHDDDVVIEPLTAPRLVDDRRLE